MKATRDQKGSVRTLYITPEHQIEEEFLSAFFESQDDVGVQYSEDPRDEKKRLSFTKAY